LVGLFPDVALSVEVETNKVRVGIGIRYSSDELAPNPDDDIFLGSFIDLDIEVAISRFFDGYFAD
jgi:hypothetical protein